MYETAVVRDLFKIGQDTLGTLHKLELVKTAVPARGTGTKRLYIMVDLYKIQGVFDLRKAGFSREKASAIIYDNKKTEEAFSRVVKAETTPNSLLIELQGSVQQF